MAIREISYLAKTYKISYEIKNPDKEKSILIIHGWGANKEIMIKAFGSCLSEFKQIYIDLPGFGRSDIFYELDSIKYAKIVQVFLSSLKLKPDIIMGHSFGGKIATLLRPENLVLLSTAGIVEEKPFVVNFKIKLYKFLKIFGFAGLYKLFATKDVAGMSRVMYDTLKNVVDEDFREVFSKTKAKTLIFWGEGDKAVSLESGKTINRLIKNSEFFPLAGDHFFFLIHSKFISDTIENNFKNISKKNENFSQENKFKEDSKAKKDNNNDNDEKIIVINENDAKKDENDLSDDEIVQDLVLVSDIVKRKKIDNNLNLDKKIPKDENYKEVENNDFKSEKQRIDKTDKDTQNLENKSEKSVENDTKNIDLTQDEAKKSKKRAIRFSDIYKYKVQKALKEIKKEEDKK